MQLEVVLTKKGLVKGSLSSLFSPITQSGFQLLRANLIHPLNDEEVLNDRYEAVSVIIENHKECLRSGRNDTFFELLKKLLKEFKYFDTCVGSFTKKTILNDLPADSEVKARILNLVKLKNYLKIVPALSDLFKQKEELSCKLLDYLFREIELGKIRDISREIDRVIDPTTTTDLKAFLKMKGVFLCIQRNINENLDLARDVYSETMQTISDWIRSYNEMLPGVGMALEFSEIRGAYFSFNAKLREDLE